MSNDKNPLTDMIPLLISGVFLLGNIVKLIPVMSAKSPELKSILENEANEELNENFAKIESLKDRLSEKMDSSK